MVQPPWQDALNPQLAQRLLRPLVCPGVIPDTLAMAIFERSRQFKQRLSLLHQFQQRWNKQSNLQVPDVPIVYAQWIAPATQSAISENPSDPNRQGSSESMRIEREHTTLTQIVAQQPINEEPTSPSLPLVIQAKLVNPAASTVTSPLPSIPSDSKPLQSSIIEDRESALPSVNAGAEPTSPSLPLVIQAKLVNPAASTVTSPLPPIPSDSKPLQSSIIADRESALPSVNAGAGSISQRPQLPIVTPSPRSPLLDQKLNRGISSLAEEKALVVKAENQAVLPTSPQLRSPVTNQLPLSIVTSPSTGSVPNTAIADSAVASARLLEELPLVKVENTAALSSSQALRHPTQPLVFARPAPTYVSPINQELPMMPTATSHQPTERSPVITAQPADQKLSTPTVSSTQSPPLNVNRLAHQVEQKLMRKLIVERERRGQRTWHW